MLKIFLIHLFVVIFFLAITFYFAAPLFLGGRITGGDTLLHIWLIAWNNHQFFSDPLNLFQANFFAPHQYTLAFTENELGLTLIAAPILKIFNDHILAYNFLIIFGFVVSGYGMYLLAYHLTKNRAAALLSGVIYAFAPFKLAHGFERLHLTGFSLPFIFLFLHRFSKSKKMGDLLWLTFFVILTAWSSLHYFVFLPLVFLIFLALNYWPKKINGIYRLSPCFSWRRERKMAGQLLAAFLIVFVFISPLFYVYFKFQSLNHLFRPEAELINYSPVFLDYFLPVFGANAFYNFADSHENIVGIGFVVWLLLILCFIFYVKSIRNFSFFNSDVHESFAGDSLRSAPACGNDNFEGIKFRFYAYSILGVFSFLFSLGPFLKFSHQSSLYFLGPFYLFRFLPGFSGIRAPGRFSIFFLIAVSVLISLGLSEFFKSQRKILKRTILAILMFLILSEFSFIKPVAAKFAKASKFQQIPLVYNWLKNQAGNFIILELPLGWNNSSRSYDYNYVYHSIYHWKKLVNGPPSGVVFSDYYQLNKDLKKFELSKVEDWLKKYQVKYLIFHRDKYEELLGKSEAERIFQALAANAEIFLPLNQFADDYAYEYAPNIDSAR